MEKKIQGRQGLQRGAEQVEGGEGGEGRGGKFTSSFSLNSKVN